MARNTSYEELVIASNQNIKEKEYWLYKLSGEINKCSFPYDHQKNERKEVHLTKIHFKLEKSISDGLVKLSNNSDHSLHVILLAGVVVLLERYLGNTDTIIGTPIYKTDQDFNLMNTALPIRCRVHSGHSFKDILIQAKQNIIEAIEHQNYPLEVLIEQLGFTISDDEFPLFDVVVLIKNIHRRDYILHTKPNIVFSFFHKVDKIVCDLEYNNELYDRSTIERLILHLKNLLKQVISNVNLKIAKIDILAVDERKELLFDLNDTKTDYPGEKAIHELFQEQTRLNPDKNAVVSEKEQMTYSDLNKKANQLANYLRLKGITSNDIVGLLFDRSLDMIIGMLGVLKAGGAYLPLDPEYPKKQIINKLVDSNASILISRSDLLKKHSFAALQGLSSIYVKPVLTDKRPHIKDFNKIPIPNRSLVNYEMYNKYIDEALVKNCISIQGTRGCPYKCAYCHKIWPKSHVVRSAENIFDEIKFYYDMGVRRFAFIDDIFNLHRKNSTRFYELIIKNNLKIQLFFPNGLRGDILNKSYIDIMVEAGLIYIAIALETASPRLQKLIGKNLNIEKLYENTKYICKEYPHVITALFTMHGFPSETEEEAMMTLNFINSIKWLHFPHINILKIYPNTAMAEIAVENGISLEAIYSSQDQGYHELPDTLPFDKSFTLKYQAEFLNEYFLSKERLLHVLPYQIKSITESELIQKLNSYLPKEINSLNEFMEFTGISREELGNIDCLDENYMVVPDLHRKMKSHFKENTPHDDALKILLLDLSQSFTWESHLTNHLIEPPLGLIYLLSYLNQQLGDKIDGKIVKALIDFDNYDELKKIIDEFKPDIIGIRALNFYKEFFHRTITIIRQWGIEVPIITGGPYATSAYDSVLQDGNIDLIVMGEGEITFAELIHKIIENDKKLLDENALMQVPGLAFIPQKSGKLSRLGRKIILTDFLENIFTNAPDTDLANINKPHDLAYVMYTSGSTGGPKGVMVEHQNVVRLVKNTNFLQFSEDDRILQTGACDFDASTFEIWGALLNGLTLFLARKEDILTPKNLKELIQKHNITTMWFTSPLFNHILQEDIEVFYGLKNLLVGGDVLSPLNIKRLKERYPGLNVINGYGPTENTTFSATHFINDINDNNIPIGKPIANSSVYILKDSNQLVPFGVPGELYVGGSGVARGYLNNPELTHEKFIPNPFIEGDRLYRTGDYVRWLPEKNLEFLSRIDQQVKIRGYRIELKEIENHLLKINEIAEAVVVQKESKDGNNYLCAYYVTSNCKSVELPKNSEFAKTNLEPKFLKECLAKELADYMIPAYFVELPEIPLTFNGKVDKGALPEPERIGVNESYFAPRNDNEKKLAHIWADTLEIDENLIGIDSDFFQLGGHSLRATTLISRIHKEFNVKIPLTDIFETPTIRAISRHLDKRNEENFIPITKAAIKEYYPLSAAQKRIYIMNLRSNNATGFNIPNVSILEGNLNIERMKITLEKLVHRHESLRTSFPVVEGDVVQKIHESVEFEIEFFSLSSITTPQNLITEQKIIEKFIRPFDLSKIPLFRIGLIRLEEEKHILVVDMHHIITDAVSMAIFINEFKALYHEQELPELQLQYKDFSEWQNIRLNSGEFKKQEEFWINKFQGEIPILNMPVDFSRSQIINFEGNEIHYEFDKKLVNQLKQFVLENGITLNVVIIAAYNVLLAKYTDQEDIIIGSLITGRNHIDMQNIIGVFTNSIAIRNYPLPDKKFDDFLVEVKKNTLEAYDNQDYQFNDLVQKLDIKQDPTRHPVYSTLITYQNIEIPELILPGLTLKSYHFDNKSSKFDIYFDIIEEERALRIVMKYLVELYKKSTIEKIIQHFVQILEQIIRNKKRRLSDIKLSIEVNDIKSNIFKDDLDDFEI